LIDLSSVMSPATDTGDTPPIESVLSATGRVPATVARPFDLLRLA
jgi:hypothetical protein